MRHQFSWAWLAILATTAAACSDSLAPTSVTVEPVITTGNAHTCMVARSGAASCWGDNADGQLGDGSTTSSPTPVAVAGGMRFRATTAGARFTCALDFNPAADAWCWGLNDLGQLGTGTTANSATPAAVSGAMHFTSLVTGSLHVCGLRSDAAAYCWGYNGRGRLGTGDTTSSPAPVAVQGGLTFSALAAGGVHTCGLTHAGAVYCWGENGTGQLGNGAAPTPSSVPVPVSGGLTFIAIAAGWQHTCAVTAAGTMYCWGDNESGEVGQSGPANGFPVPTQVSGGMQFAQLTAGSYHTCGFTSSGAAYCWGRNDEGELGSGTAGSNRYRPVAVTGGLTFKTIAAGGAHTCALTSAVVPYCWGSNSVGQLGRVLQRVLSPTAVDSLSTTGAVSGGGTHTCTLLPTAQAMCWGANAQGQLGNGSTTPRATPVAVSGGYTFRAVSAGASHSCALDALGTGYCWGLGGFGQLGRGSFISGDSVPGMVSGGIHFTAITAGVLHTCGLSDSAQAFCWGLNGAGEVGDSSTTLRNAPVRVAGGLTFTALAAGAFQTCGLVGSGAAYCWGSNWSGQLGDSSTATRSAPTAVSGGLTFTLLVLGGSHTCGLASSGSAYCWGYNGQGQLGTGDTLRRLVPSAVSAGLTFASLAAGGNYTCGLSGGGALYCWGENTSGQFGNGTTTSSEVPVAAAGSTTFASIATGGAHACGLTGSGRVYCWGDDYWGQLGIGMFGFSATPLAVQP